MTSDGAILVLNSGSSSVKFALFNVALDEPQRVFQGLVERIGVEEGHFVASNVDGEILVDQLTEIPNHIVALDLLLGWIEKSELSRNLVAVGHRVVHGGNNCDCPVAVTPALEERLRRLTPLAPLHLPHNRAGILAVRLRRPDLPQIACFDTAFHHGLPPAARMTGLPLRIAEDDIRRYGYHGLSYEYVIDDVRKRDGLDAANSRIIVAHLGNGASMAAIKSGRSVDTTMGFSTLAGLPMGTRSGDVDPGLVLYLLQEKGMSTEALEHLLYNECGLLGLSGLSRNMSDLLEKREVSEVAVAIEYFCHHARRHLVGLTASLSGLDRLIFTGGIGANSPEIRAQICEGLSYLGIDIDDHRNFAQESVISKVESPVRIEAVKTDEELAIARHTQGLLDASLEKAKEQSNG